jgi:hypothetical protein
MVQRSIPFRHGGHKYHERAYFALKPTEISDNKRCLKAKFFWLPQHRHSNQVDPLRTPLTSEGLGHGPCQVKIYNVETDKKICSGDEICLETNDPDRLPLPDWRLLDMQWILHRVAAMSGAAEPRDDFYEGSDDDWGESVGDIEDIDAEDE